MLKQYDLKIKKILLTKAPEVNWKEVLENHRGMITKIQHERLIHLLVTIFVGLVMTTCAFISITSQKSDLLVIFIPLFFLFVAYLFHYRFLENTTQDWYLIEDEVKKYLA